MAQKLTYNFRSNGWTQSMVLNIEMQKPIDNKINVNWSITGIADGIGHIDLKEGKLYTNKFVEIKPYEDNGKIKKMNIFKVEKFTLLQMKDYCSN